MADEDNFLKGELARLNREVAELKTEAKTHRIGKKTALAEVERLNGQVVTLTTDRDSWKTKADAAPSELQAKLDEANGKILQRDHRDAFEALRSDGEVGLNPTVKFEALQQLLGYKAEGDPDPAKIRALVVGARDAHPYLFGQAGETPKTAPGGATGSATKPPLVVDVGTGRGGRDTAASSLRVTKAQMQDPAWKLEPKNAAMVRQAQKDGTLVVLDA